MPQLVCSGATLNCSFGAAPSALVALPKGQPVLVSGMPAATIMDHQPMVNIPPFAMCMTLTNPQVAAATTAALGVFTPQPCIPVTTTPWSPGSPTVLVNGQPALNNTSTCMCMWGGVISVASPGQMQTNVP